MKDKELESLKREVNVLKQKKERALSLSSNYEERNRLMREIAELNAIKKSPSKMKGIGNTFLRGLKMTGSSLWKATKRASRNLSQNSPEFKEMAQQKPKASQPYSPLLMRNYFPQTQPVDIDGAMNYRAEPMRKVKPLMTKKQLKKMKKRGFRVTDKALKMGSPTTWELP